MKKAFLAALVVVLTASCSSVRKTATAVDVNSQLSSYNVADLQVSQEKVTYEFRPTAKERRGGKTNVISCAYAAALVSNGNADVLVQPEYTMRISHGLFGKKIKEVTVTGYPAKYKNFTNGK